MQIIIDIPPILELVAGAFATVFGWLFGRVFFRYMFLPWLGHRLAIWFTARIKPTKRDAIILRHYALRRRGRIHLARWPWQCEDGKCGLL